MHNVKYIGLCILCIPHCNIINITCITLSIPVRYFSQLSLLKQLGISSHCLLGSIMHGCNRDICKHSNMDMHVWRTFFLLAECPLACPQVPLSVKLRSYHRPGSCLEMPPLGSHLKCSGVMSIILHTPSSKLKNSPLLSVSMFMKVSCMRFRNGCNRITKKTMEINMCSTHTIELDQYNNTYSIQIVSVEQQN